MDCVNQMKAMYPNQDVDALKKKVIKEFTQLLKKLKKGYREDYEFILQEISLIQLLESQDIDNTVFFKQFYLNNAWQTQY